MIKCSSKVAGRSSMSCPGSLRHQDYLQSSRKSSRCYWNEITQHSDTYGCKEGKFRKCDLGCRYCSTQFAWRPLKQSLQGYGKKKIKTERSEVLSEQDRTNHKSVMSGAEHMVPNALSCVLSEPTIPVPWQARHHSKVGYVLPEVSALPAGLRWAGWLMDHSCNSRSNGSWLE